MRNKTPISWLAAAATASVAALLLVPEPTPLPTQQSTRPESNDPPAAHNTALASLPARAAIGPTRRDLFSVRDSAPKSPPVMNAAPAAPTPPPLPYRVAGHVLHDGKAQLVLMKGDRLLTVQQGDVLEDSYRVQSIEGSGVTLVYTPLGVAQHLPLPPSFVPQPQRALAATPSAEQAAALSGPARLHWEGPERVFAGSPFEVVLRLASAQPVRSSPLELTYDAKLLEPVAVRAGGYFADGKFSYRVVPSGSIHVGASRGKALAADLDLLILTFRAIRSGGSAELKLSSVVLESADGDAITHEPPAAFRTTIVQ